MRTNDGRSCQLSEQRVDSPGVKTVKSSLCFNYQLAEDFPDGKRNRNNKNLPSPEANADPSTEVKMAGFESFGIIMAFAVAGLVTGSVGFTIWKIHGQRLRGLSLNRHFSWSRFTDQAS